jgi:hypothetical protein
MHRIPRWRLCSNRGVTGAGSVICDVRQNEAPRHISRTLDTAGDLVWRPLDARRPAGRSFVAVLHTGGGDPGRRGTCVEAWSIAVAGGVVFVGHGGLFRSRCDFRWQGGPACSLWARHPACSLVPFCCGCGRGVGGIRSGSRHEPQRESRSQQANGGRTRRRTE